MEDWYYAMASSDEYAEIEEIPINFLSDNDFYKVCFPILIRPE